MPVVRTDGQRVGGVPSRDYKFSGMGRFTYPFCSAGALRAPELRYKQICTCLVVQESRISLGTVFTVFVFFPDSFLVKNNHLFVALLQLNFNYLTEIRDAEIYASI